MVYTLKKDAGNLSKTKLFRLIEVAFIFLTLLPTYESIKNIILHTLFVDSFPTIRNPSLSRSNGPQWMFHLKANMNLGLQRRNADQSNRSYLESSTNSNNEIIDRNHGINGNLIPFQMEGFEFVESYIEKILTMDPSNLSSDRELGSYHLVNNSTLCICWDQFQAFLNDENISTNNTLDLSHNGHKHHDKNKSTQSRLSIPHILILAMECDRALFPTAIVNTTNDLPQVYSNIPLNIMLLLSPIFDIYFNKTYYEKNDNHEMKNLKDQYNLESKITMTTLLSFLLLESNIQQQTSYERGKAPLLKDMIEQILNIHCKNGQDQINLEHKSKYIHLVMILRTLLLPNEGGINLRNLLWHGFISKIHRRWLSLSIVLSITIQKEFLNINENENSKKQSLQEKGKSTPDKNFCDESLINLKRYKAFLPIINHGRNILKHSKFHFDIDENEVFLKNKEINTQKIKKNSMDTSLYDLYKKLTLSPIQYHQYTETNHKFTKKATLSYIAHTNNDLSLQPFIPKVHHPLLYLAFQTLSYENQQNYQEQNHEDFYISKPACFIAIMMPIIEHSLRLLWCEVNHKFEDKIARVGSYYVTLDGIGQKDKHDVMVNALVNNVNQSRQPNGSQINVDEKRPSSFKPSSQHKNELVTFLGGTIFSILADLFGSPFGPNIRSTVAHGIWNTHIWRELSNNNNARRGLSHFEVKYDTKKSLEQDEQNQSILMATVCSLLSVLDLIAERYHAQYLSFPTSDILTNHSKVIQSSLIAPIYKEYRPVFSYCAFISRNIVHIIDEFSKLFQNEIILNETGSPTIAVHPLDQLTDPISIPLERIENMKNLLTITTDCIDEENHFEEWSPSHVLREYKLNVVLSDCGAASSLLTDIDIALSEYNKRLNDGLVQYNTYLSSLDDTDGHLKDRHQKELQKKINQWRRLSSFANISYNFYSFCTYVALFYIEQKIKIQKDDSQSISIRRGQEMIDEKFCMRTVERSRMCLSTYSKFITVNPDRAFKALQVFLQSKYVKKIVNDLSS